MARGLAGTRHRTPPRHPTHDTYRYLKSKAFRERKGRSDAGRSFVDPWDAWVIARRNAGQHNGRQMLRELRERGFIGNYTTVLRYLNRPRAAQRDAVSHHPRARPGPPLVAAPKRVLTPRTAAWVVPSRPEQRGMESRALLARLREHSGVLPFDKLRSSGEAIGLAEEFAALVRECEPERLDLWLQRAQDGAVPSLRRFAGRLATDYDAVRAAVMLDWSNGLVEGQINRLKTIKRQMYNSHDHSAYHGQANRQPDCRQQCHRKVGETVEGIIVRGAKVLATLAPYADEQTVYPSQPLPPEARRYALAFAVPLDTPGLKFLCRDPASSPGADPFDKPLSSRFDEQDAFCIFDDVLVPWGRIFIDGDVQIYNLLRKTGFHINMTSQSTTRALTKLEFAYGLATRMAELIGDDSPATTEMLGELACYVRLTRNAIELSLEQAWEREDGVWFPNGAAIDPMRAMLAVWMPRAAEIITLIGSHNLLTTPNRAQLDDGELRPLIDEMLHGADGAGADERAAVFRMAWDFVGSSLAGRGFLYEMSASI